MMSKRLGVLLSITLLFAGGLNLGCDTVEPIFERENEVTVAVEEVNTNESYLVADGIQYDVTSDTEFEGVGSLSELAQGDEVEIEYDEGSDGARTAKEIELAGSENENEDDSDDGGLFG